VPRSCRLFLFDLDGTLVDSKEDIARAVNAVLIKIGEKPLSMTHVLQFVGEGIELLIQRALRESTGREPDADQVGRCMNFMIQEYDRHLFDASTLYPGVRETLDALQGAKMGLITNKLEALARRVLQGFGLYHHFSVVMGGDSLPQRKPDPAPLFTAMARCGIPPSETVMVGDSNTDILAGKAAGVMTCGLSGGYRGRDELVAAGSDVVIDEISDLLRHFSAPSA
jgi:phosphoglycolate phosphatase